LKRFLLSLSVCLALTLSLSSAIISPLPFTFQNGTVADATQVNANFNQIVSNVNANAFQIPFSPPQLTVFAVHGSGTYTVPLNAAGALPAYLEVMECGSGGGGAGGGTGQGNGSTGTVTRFGSFTVNAGQAGFTNGGGGAAGANGCPTCSIDISGTQGGIPKVSTTNATFTTGGYGAGSAYFGAITEGIAGGNGVSGRLPCTGGSGGGTTSGTATGGGGGGSGEWGFIQINNPAASYTYQVGNGGAGGAGAQVGGKGADGYIQINARWQ
jgi:hypothetical protein